MRTLNGIGLQKTYDIVKTLLTHYPQYRNSDERLVARIWWDEMKAMGINGEKITAKELLQLMVDKRLTRESSVRRARRKVAEENKDLRGVVYKSRQQREEVVKEEVRHIDNNSPPQLEIEL